MGWKRCAVCTYLISPDDESRHRDHSHDDHTPEYIPFKDHKPVEIPGPVKVGRTSFAIGDKVEFVNRWRDKVSGTISRFEREDTKLTATADVLRRKHPLYLASVRHDEHTSSLTDVRKLVKAA